MFQAYMNIFSRIGLHFRAVEADSGAMGGKGTHKFMALSDSGEDTIVLCSHCEYAANVEMAEVPVSNDSRVALDSIPAMEKVATPGQKTIAEVSSFLQVSEQETVKSLLFMVDGRPVLAMVRGDHEVNEIKVKNVLGTTVCELASPTEIQEWTGTVAGYIGPVGLGKEVTIVADHALQALPKWIVGANEQDQHYVHLMPGRDVEIKQYADIRLVQEGDSCPHCGQSLTFQRGIELGHIFKLGTRYSESMEATVLDQDGRARVLRHWCFQDLFNHY
jgi:prolyl-tRNA synthetase